jgi:hypothetical protein
LQKGNSVPICGIGETNHQACSTRRSFKSLFSSHRSSQSPPSHSRRRPKNSACHIRGALAPGCIKLQHVKPSGRYGLYVFRNAPLVGSCSLILCLPRDFYSSALIFSTGLYPIATNTMSQFQLFPPPSPEVRAQRNPFRKGVKKPVPKNEPPSPIPLEEIKSSTNTESVLLQIIEDTQHFPPPPALPATNFARSKSPATQSSQQSKPPQSPRNRRHQNTSPMNHRPLPSQGSAGDSSSNSDQNTNSTTSPQSSQSSVSPLPMRSMFPRFDPKTSLNTQDNDSQMPTETLKPKPNRRPNLTLTTTSDIDHVLGPKTVPASVFNFPTGALEPEEIRYSSVQDLEMLWEAANGQRPRNTCGTVNLRLTR